MADTLREPLKTRTDSSNIGLSSSIFVKSRFLSSRLNRLVAPVLPMLDYRFEYKPCYKAAFRLNEFINLFNCLASDFGFPPNGY